MKNIIFDLDGTLWDPTNIILKAWEETLNSFNELELKVTKEDLKNVFGMQDSLIGRTLFPHLNTETVNMVMEKCFNMENEYISKHGGDTQGDKEGAEQNNIPFIYAEYEFKDLKFNKYSINSISKLPKLLVRV